MRYRLLETLRQYGRERLLASEEAIAVRDRHARFYLTLLANAKLSSADQQAELQRVEREHDNIRAALDWWDERGDVELVLRATGQWRHWYLHGHVHEGLERVMRALRRSDAQAPTRARSNALHCATSLVMWQGDLTAARALAAERLALDQALGIDPIGATYTFASLERAAGDLGSARTHLEEAVRDLASAHESGHVHVLLGNVLRLQGELSLARTHIQDGLQLFREGANGRPTSQIAHALDWLAVVAYEQEDDETARASWREALLIRQSLADKTEIADTLQGFAALAVRSGAYARVLRLEAAAAARRKSGATMLPAEQPRLDRWLTPAREALSKQARDTAWKDGETMSLDQAIAYALEDDSPGGAGVPVPLVAGKSKGDQ